MPRGAPEPDAGTGPAGPLQPARRGPPAPPPSEADWITEDPARPYLQRNRVTGQYRTRDYDPYKPLTR